VILKAPKHVCNTHRSAERDGVIVPDSECGYETVFFDMDGVVVDTAESVARFWRDLAAERSRTLSPL
jgi:hypothetical protein